MAPLLEVRNLSRTPILREISFQLEQKDHLLVVGQNGAGKSTLLRCLDLILTDWTGTVALDGVSIREIPRKRFAQKVALVRQSAEVIPDMTVRRFVLTGRYPYRALLSPLTRHDEDAAGRALELTETAPFAERKLASLSGGERQRVWLAAALAQEPELFLLDEPTVFLDYRGQNEISRLLERIRTETGAALIEVTHDLNRLNRSATAVLALAGGRAVYCGPPSGMMNAETLRSVFETELRLLGGGAGGGQFVLPENNFPAR